MGHDGRGLRYSVRRERSPCGFAAVLFGARSEREHCQGAAYAESIRPKCYGSARLGERHIRSGPAERTRTKRGHYYSTPNHRRRLRLRILVLLRKPNESSWPRRESNLDSKSFGNHSLNAVGLFELPRKLPISIARCGGTAWYLLGSQPACHPADGIHQLSDAHRAKRHTTRAHPLGE